MKDEILPGYTRITEISGAFSGYGSIPKSILQNAADRGNQVHGIIKDVILDIPVDGERYIYRGEKKSDDLMGYMKSFWEFWRPLQDCQVEFIDRMYDHKVMLTGETDLIAVIDGERVLIDWKCTSMASPAWDIQANGYTWMYENLHEKVIDKMLFIRLDKEGRAPEVIEIKHDTELFTTAFEFYLRFFKGLNCNLECE